MVLNSPHHFNTTQRLTLLNCTKKCSIQQFEARVHKSFFAHMVYFKVTMYEQRGKRSKP